MRRKGILALVIYVLATVVGGFFSIWGYTEIERIQNNGGGLEGLGAAIIFALGLMILVPYLVCLIVKIIQLISGAKLFSVLMIICDIAVIGFVAYTVIEGGFNVVYSGIALIPSAVALISNIGGLKN